MKHLLISTRLHPSFDQISSNQQNGILISNKQENWSLDITCQENDGTTDRELAEITINLHNGKKWQGSIQALAAIDDFVHNAQLALTYKNLDEETRFEAFKDLTSLRSHFGAGQPLQPAQYLSVLQRELTNIRKSIDAICNNFTDTEVIQELGTASDNISDAEINLQRVEKLLSQPSA